MPIGYGGLGTLANAGTSLVVAGVATPVWNMVQVIYVAQKENGTSGAITQTAGPTLVKAGEALGTFGTNGADTGKTRCAIFYRVLDGTEGAASYTFSGSTDTMYGVPWTLTSTEVFGTWSFAAVTGEDVTAGAAMTAVLPAIDLGAADYVMVGMSIPTDISGDFTSETITATGMTFGTVGEIREYDSSLGNDQGGVVYATTITAGTPASVAPTVNSAVSGTNTNYYGPIILFRARITEHDPLSVAGEYLVMQVGAIDITDVVSPAEDNHYIYMNIGVAEVAGKRTLEGWGFGLDVSGEIVETYYLPGAATYLYVNVT